MTNLIFLVKTIEVPKDSSLITFNIEVYWEVLFGKE